MTPTMCQDLHQMSVYQAHNDLEQYRKCEGEFIDFYGSTFELPFTRKFGDLRGVRAFVQAVYDLPSVRAKWHNPRGCPTVSHNAMAADMAHYDYLKNEICVPPHQGCRSSWAMGELAVLHEVAHSLTVHLNDPTGGHGREFTKCFVHLVGAACGPVWKMLAVRALDSRGVPTA